SFSLDSESNSFSNEVYDFQIRSLIKSQEDYFESVLIASSQGLWKTYINTDIITLTSTPVFYAVDTFRLWDLFEYQQDSSTSIVPLTHYPVIEIINVYEFDKYLDLGYYIYDELKEIDSSSYSISPDKKSLVCIKDGVNWNWRVYNPSDTDLYYEVRYFYEASVAQASGLLSANYKKDEYTHVGNIAAQNNQMKASKLGFQLLNPNDLNHWTFYYGTDYQDWNYQQIDVTTGVPYVLASGQFADSELSSSSFLSLTEYNNKRVNYGTTTTTYNSVISSVEMSQFETGQDFNRPQDYQDLYQNSYIDSVLVEDLSKSSSIDFSSDLSDFSGLSNLLDDKYSFIDSSLSNTVAYQPEIINVDIKSSAGPTTIAVENDQDQNIKSDTNQQIQILKNRNDFLRVYENTPSDAIQELYIDITFQLDKNEDFDSLKYILLSTSFAHEISVNPIWELGHFPVGGDDNKISIVLLDSNGNPLVSNLFKDIKDNEAFGATNIITSDADDWYRIFKTYNFGEAIYSDIITKDSKQYYKPDNDETKANFLYPLPVDNFIDRGVFMKKDDNIFEFKYEYEKPGTAAPDKHYSENHIYDYNYLRLDTDPISESFVKNGQITLRVSLEGYPAGYDTNKILHNDLILRMLNVTVFSDKDNLNSQNWDFIGDGYTKKYNDNGLILNSGSVKLNNGGKSYPTKAYINANSDTKYRAVYTFQKTDDLINFSIGSSTPYIYNPLHQNTPSLVEGINTVEISYNSADSWKFMVNGLDATGTDDGLFNPTTFDPIGNPITDLYPQISMSGGVQIILYEIKNQIFKEIASDYNNWATDFDDTLQISDIGGLGETYNNLTYSDASLQREIIFNFNDGINDFDTVFEDLRLWSDLEYSTNYDQVTQQQFDPKFPLFQWNPLSNEQTYTASPTDIYVSSTDQYYTSFPINYAAYTHLYSYFYDYSPGLPALGNIYISQVEANFYFRYADGMNVNLFYYFNNGENLFIELNDPVSQAGSEWWIEYQTLDLSDLSYWADSTDQGTFDDAIIYTDNLDFVDVQQGSNLLFIGDGYEFPLDDLDVELYQFDYDISYTDEPNTYEDILENQEFNIDSNEITEFYIRDKTGNKKIINNTADFISSGSNIKTLLNDPTLSFEDIIYANAFGENSLSFTMKTGINFPNFADDSQTITASNKINDFVIVPKLTTEEGKGLSEPNPNDPTPYPYATSWWNDQELVSVLPFNLTFSGINDQDIEGISDIIFKVNFNVSVANFSAWSWRPNLRVYDYKNDEWLPYEGNIYAYNDIEDKIVWTGQESDTAQEKYDSIQKWHDNIYYFEFGCSFLCQ
ncbi:hypothetical protein LCGC14_1297540, partial [marine sediment metagenome]